MNEISLRAPAKINLTLDIVGQREDGYHLLRTIMQTVDLADMVTIQKNDTKEITLTVSNPDIPTDRKNTAYKAVEFFFEKTNIPFEGILVDIQKWIPCQAGMAGGSADAAAVLNGLNQLYDNPLSVEELCAIAVRIGADVPFCVIGGAALATGIGEVLTPIKALPKDLSIVVCKPPVGISTAEAYHAIDEHLDSIVASDEQRILDALEKGDITVVGDCLQNDFEQALDNQEIKEAIEHMNTFAPIGCRMTGSGSAIYAFFDNEEEARDCAFGMMEYGQVYICHPC